MERWWSLNDKEPLQSHTSPLVGFGVDLIYFCWKYRKGISETVGYFVHSEARNPVACIIVTGMPCKQLQSQKRTGDCHKPIKTFRNSTANINAHKNRG